MNIIKSSLVSLLLAVFIAQSFAAKDCGYGMYYDGQYCSDCGVATIEPNVRVVGGVEAVKGSWPAQVLVATYFELFGMKFLESYCGGTLISRYTVLSAAHCLGNSPYHIYYIYAGAYNISAILEGEPLDSDISVHRARKGIGHPSYSESTILNDVALFLLDEPVTTSDTVNVACLPKTSSSYPSYNSTVYLAGWGLNAADGSANVILHNINMTVYDPDNCNDVSPETPKNWNGQICAGELVGGKGPCMGDSGGAIITPEIISFSTRYVVSGIVSYGIPCALEGLPSVFTRTSYYIDWIKENWQTEALPTTTTKEVTTHSSTRSSKTTTHIYFTDEPSLSVKTAFISKYNVFSLMLLSLLLIIL